MSTKMVIVMRADLRNVDGGKLRTGKFVAQGGHAIVGVIEKQGVFTQNLDNIDWGHKDCTSEDNFLVIRLSSASRNWFSKDSGFTKVCASCNSEKELLELYSKALNAGLPAQLITDSGRTEFNGVPTRTCIAIGPAEIEEIDKITGHLPLL